MNGTTVSECPQCGAPSDQNKVNCEYCKATFYIQKISYYKGLNNDDIRKYLAYYKNKISEDQNNYKAHLGIGITYLELGMVEFAIKAFDKCIELSPEIPDSYHYSALALINGRRVMTLNKNDIQKVISRINAAIKLDPKNGVYIFLLAIVKKDYFEKNKLRDDYPTYGELIDEVTGIEINAREVACVKKYVRVENFDLVSSKVQLK
jgi:tetratricopeptide (TPR) repeat protein